MAKHLPEDLVAEWEALRQPPKPVFRPGGIVKGGGGWCAPSEIQYENIPVPPLELKMDTLYG